MSSRIIVFHTFNLTRFILKFYTDSKYPDIHIVCGQFLSIFNQKSNFVIASFVKNLRLAKCLMVIYNKDINKQEKLIGCLGNWFHLLQNESVLYCLFVCLGFFVPHENFSLIWRPLPVKGCKFLPMLGTHGH